METTTIKDKVLNGKNSQSIRATLKARTPKSFEIKNKGNKVSQEVIQTVRLPHAAKASLDLAGRFRDTTGSHRRTEPVQQAGEH